jgi:hypothetical protein
MENSLKNTGNKMKIPNYRQWQEIPSTHPEGAQFYADNNFFKIGHFNQLYRWNGSDWIVTHRNKEELFDLQAGYVKDKWDLAAEKKKKERVPKQSPHWDEEEFNRIVDYIRKGIPTTDIAIMVNRTVVAIRTKLCERNTSIHKLRKEG